MTLTDRYLAAVRWNLPADKADDISEELADLIAARIEDREEALGRPLRQDEIGALLKEFGHPLTVAGRYHGQQALIGPELFPFYWFVLRLVLAIVALVQAVQVAGRLVFGSEPFMRALMHGLSSAWISLPLNAALVTIAFAVVERSGWLETYLERWSPDKLPDLSSWRMPSPSRGSRSRHHPRNEAIANLVFGAAFLIWWFGGFGIPVVPHNAGVLVQPAPVWALLYWPVAAVIATRMIHGVVTLIRPAWRPLRAALVIGCSAGGLAVMAVLYQAGQIITVTAKSEQTAQAAVDIQSHLDRGLSISLIALAAITVVQAAVELWRLYREQR